MRRLFTALEIPASHTACLTALQGGVEGARWIESASFHITLRYIGPVEEPVARDLATALEEKGILAGRGDEGFKVTLKGVGVFGKSRLRALWAGVEGGEDLTSLHGTIDRTLTRLGLPDARNRYIPHVTLARLRPSSVNSTTKRAIRSWLEMHGGFSALPFEVRGFTLFSSRPGSGGGPYVREQVYEYGG